MDLDQSGDFRTQGWPLRHNFESKSCRSPRKTRSGVAPSLLYGRAGGIEMKKRALLGAISFCLSVNAVAGPKVPVSVLRFNQEVAHIYDGCRSWGFTEQNQLRSELERQLALQGLQILERTGIRKIYADEYEMPNLNEKTVAKKKQFIAARYTITGGISELGICEESSHSGVQLGGLVSLLGGPSVDLGGKKGNSKSRVKVIAQVVSVETGEIVDTFEAYSEISDDSYGVNAGVMGIGVEHHESTRPPIEKATNQAIHDLAAQIAKGVS